MPKEGPSRAVWLKPLSDYTNGNFKFQCGQKPRKNSTWADKLQKIDNALNTETKEQEMPLGGPLFVTGAFTL